MLTVRALLPADGPRDPDTVTAALVVAERHRTAILAVLSVLRDLFNQCQDKGAEDGAKLMAEATGHVLKDESTIKATIAELQEIGGAGIAGWQEISRADIRRQTRTRETQRDLIVLSGRYLKSAVEAARLDRLEAAAAVVDLTVKTPGPSAGTVARFRAAFRAALGMAREAGDE